MYFEYLEHGPGQLSAIYLKKRRDGPKLCPHHKHSRAVILTTSQRPKLLNIYTLNINQKPMIIIGSEVIVLSNLFLFLDHLLFINYILQCVPGPFNLFILCPDQLAIISAIKRGRTFSFPAPTQPVDWTQKWAGLLFVPFQLSL